MKTIAEMFHEVKPGIHVCRTVEWSYPTSPNAEKWGVGKTGAWGISTCTIKGDDAKSKSIGPFSTEASARAAATAYGWTLSN